MFWPATKVVAVSPKLEDWYHAQLRPNCRDAPRRKAQLSAKAGELAVASCASVRSPHSASACTCGYISVLSADTSGVHGFAPKGTSAAGTAYALENFSCSPAVYSSRTLSRICPLPATPAGIL